MTTREAQRNPILCVCADGSVPGVYPCVIQGEHLNTCTGYNGRGEECAGCAPRPAERGYLCAKHYDDVEHAYARWPEWRSQVTLGGARLKTADSDGRSSGTLGSVNYHGWMLAADECDRLIRSLEQMPKPSLSQWVFSESGARDAVQFAKAAVRAYEDHPVREQSSWVHTRCPSCGLKTLKHFPPAYFPSEVRVTCQNDACRRDLTQDALEALIEIEKNRKRA